MMTAIQQTVVRESQLEVLPSSEERQSEGRGGDLQTSFFEFSVVFPIPVITVCFTDEELSDDEVVQAAALSGSFAFLDSEEEDIYNSATSPSK